MADEAARQRVRELFAQRHASGTAPGLVYGVLDGGELVDSGGFGAASLGGAAPTIDTAFRIASCTKSFTATALLQQRDAGRLDLDAPITDHAPTLDLRLPTPDSPVPTLRMLATMSGGLATDDPWGDRLESISDAELDTIVGSGIRAISVPGTEFEYSNLGWALLGRAIARAAGRPYRDVVRTDVLAPLGLTATDFTTDVAAPDGIATGHRKHGDAWEPLPFSGPGAFSPIGGLFSTVRDMTRWMHEHVAAWHGGADDVLATSSRREMQQLQRLVEPTPGQPLTITGYGYGLFIVHDGVHGLQVGHSGGYPGFSAYMRWHPATGLGVVGFENATYAGVGKTVGEALNVLVECATVPEVTPWPETLAAQQALHGLLTRWDDGVTSRWMGPSVDLDIPLERRRAVIEALVADVGPLADVVEATSATPAQRRWKVAAAGGTLVCELLMDPTDEPRVQAFAVTRGEPD